MARTICAVVLAVVLLGCGGKLSGVVSAATPEAAEAGRRVLAAGGNAIDAAVAVSFALGVTEPAGSGLGGQTVMIVDGPDQDPFVIDGTSRAPHGLPRNIRAADLVGRRASTVPTTVRTLAFAHARLGSGRASWASLLAPAIEAAEGGFPLGRFRQAATQKHADDLRADLFANRALLAGTGAPPAPGDVLRQPLLAETLRRLATAGAEDFYTGGLAREIADDLGVHGAWITAQDLATVPEPRVVEPLTGRYRELEVHTLPPPYGGWVVLLALAILEQAPAEALRSGGHARLTWLAGALRHAHRARADAPVADLVRYGPHVERRLSADAVNRAAESIGREGTGETTHFTVVDADGMVVAVTQSINAYFGARVMHPTLGFLYNDYMHEFVLAVPGHPYELRAGAMPYSSMSGTILASDGVPVLALGSPGSARIISAVVQVVSTWVDVARDIDAAVAAPRIHVRPGPDGDRIFIEGESPPRSVVDDLRGRGLIVTPPPRVLPRGPVDPYFGGVHAVALEDGLWRGAADPRRDGTVVRVTR